MPQISLAAFMAERLRAAGQDLYKAAEKMPEDKLSWHPQVDGNSGRDALDQILECAYLNEWAGQALRDRALPAFDEAHYKQKKDAHRNRAAALQWLQGANEAIASAAATLSADQLGETVTNPFSQQQTTWAGLADFLYWNTVYHEGQINYIQVLYGDMS